MLSRNDNIKLFRKVWYQARSNVIEKKPGDPGQGVRVGGKIKGKTLCTRATALSFLTTE